MRFAVAGGLLVAALVASAPAFAADMPVKAPVPMWAANWTGSYIGVDVGGTWGNADFFHGVDPAFAPSVSPLTARVHPSGGIVGIASGYNLQINQHFLVGYESETSVTSLRGSGGDLAPTFNPIFSNSLHENLLSTFRGRIGFVQGNWLVYGTGGAALANVTQTVTTTSATPASISETHNIWGWAAGAGVEWMPVRNLSLKLEYLHVDLANKSYFNPAPFSPLATFVNNQQLKLTEEIVRVGFAYHYDIPWGAILR